MSEKQRKMLTYCFSFFLIRQVVIVQAKKLCVLMIFKFVYKTCESLRDVISGQCIGITLTKGLDFRENNIQLFSEEISKILNIRCAALSGANLANEVAEERFGETTIAVKDPKDGEIFYKVKRSQC